MKNILQISPPPLRKLIIAFIFITLFIADFSFAQTPLFTAYQSSQVQMTSVENARYLALQDSSISLSVKIVSTADIRTTQPNDTIFFRLPGVADTIWAEASLISDDSISGFHWSGKLLNKIGYIALWYRNGLVAGFIQEGYHFYELMPLNTTYQFLVKRNNTEIKSCGLPATATSPPEPGEDECGYPTEHDNYNTCPALISVLFVVTEEAKDWILNNGFGSIDAYILSTQATVNQAFYNSDIPNKEIRTMWIERANIGLSDPPDIDDDRLLLPVLIGTERTQYKADVAFLLTNQGYSNAGGAATNFGPSVDEAFAIVEVPNALPEYYVAHELGHLIGCRHNWPYDFGNDNEKTCAHGKRKIPVPIPIIYNQINEVDTWMTIMGIPAPTSFAAIQDDNGTYYLKFVNDMRILHYSNPDVSYDGESTGRDNGYIANNARYIRNDACTVANFFPTRELGAFVSYAFSSPCLTTNNFSAYILQPENGIPGQPPYTVKWYWNSSGHFSSNDPGQYLGQGQSITISPYPACPVFWLRCEVTSSDGIRINRIQKIRIGSTACCSTSPEERETGIQKDKPANKVFPNPSGNGSVNVSLGHASQEIHFQIADLSGRIVSEGNLVSDNEGNLIIDVNKLASGTYVLRLENGIGETNNHKFTVIQN